MTADRQAARPSSETLRKAGVRTQHELEQRESTFGFGRELDDCVPPDVWLDAREQEAIERHDTGKHEGHAYKACPSCYAEWRRDSGIDVWTRAQAMRMTPEDK